MATTTVLIQYLQLDQSYDPIFDPTADLTNLDAVAQSILTRLNLFLGEWWENLALGLPVFQQILGQLGSSQGLSAMQLAVQQNIEGAPYVTNVIDVSLSFVNGQLNVQYNAMTQFGPVAGSTIAPGLSAASVGGQ